MHDATRNHVTNLWNEFRGSSFPDRLRGEEVDGIDLVMLDGTVAGCIQTLLSEPLNEERLRDLTARLGDLGKVLAHLDEADEVEYFSRLCVLAELVSALFATFERGQAPFPPGSDLKARLCEALGFADLDDDAASHRTVTSTRILNAVKRDRLRLQVLTRSDPAIVGLREAIDQNIAAGTVIRGIATIRKQLDCGIHDAMDVMEDRQSILRERGRHHISEDGA